MFFIKLINKLKILNESWIEPVTVSVGDYSLTLACQAEL
jgi:hypothetical protein